MARIVINPSCNVCTDEHSHAYQITGCPKRPEITIPRFRARMGVPEARQLAKHLMEAIEFASALVKEQKK